MNTSSAGQTAVSSQLVALQQRNARAGGREPSTGRLRRVATQGPEVADDYRLSIRERPAAGPVFGLAGPGWREIMVPPLPAGIRRSQWPTLCSALMLASELFVSSLTLLRIAILNVHSPH